MSSFEDIFDEFLNNINRYIENNKEDDKENMDIQDEIKKLGDADSSSISDDGRLKKETWSTEDGEVTRISLDASDMEDFDPQDFLTKLIESVGSNAISSTDYNIFDSVPNLLEPELSLEEQLRSAEEKEDYILCAEIKNKMDNNVKSEDSNDFWDLID